MTGPVSVYACAECGARRGSAETLLAGFYRARCWKDGLVPHVKVEDEPTVATAEVSRTPATMRAGTRKHRVLRLLRSRAGQWVTGPEIANAEVGGSEGLRRLRELRRDGFRIEEQRHPTRAVWLYRLIE